MRRWENEPVSGLALKDLDRKEILRTRELAIQQNRISSDTRRDAGEILDRLGLRVKGVLTQAAQVLYGKNFLPYFPQCLLKMGRFRGTEVTGEIVDNRQEHMNAFAMVREGMAFLERTMPSGGQVSPGHGLPGRPLPGSAGSAQGDPSQRRHAPRLLRRIRLRRHCDLR